MSIPWTDHKLFSTTILLNNNYSKGPNYWKLNTSILKDEHYKELIEIFFGITGKNKKQNTKILQTGGIWENANFHSIFYKQITTTKISNTKVNTKHFR